MLIPPEFTSHLAQIVGDKALGFMVEGTLKNGLKAIVRAFDRRESAAKESGDPELLRIEVERLRDVVASFQTAVRTSVVDWDWGVAQAEASDPAYVRFVDDAMDVAATSRAESKRLIAGRLIAQRLQVTTDSAEEMLLCRALRTLRELTEPQLLALSAVEFVQRLSDSKVLLNTYDDAEAWLQEHHGHLISYWVSRERWSESDLETLASVGALRMEVQPYSNNLIIEGRADALDQWLHVSGVNTHEMLTPDAGSLEWQDRNARRFPAIGNLRNLITGKTVAENVASEVPEHRRLDAVVCTPLGRALGDLALQQLR